MSRLYQIALTMLPGIGDVLARGLLDHYGSVEAVFSESAKDLVKIPGIGRKIAGNFLPEKFEPVLRRAEAELRFIEKRGIKTLFYLDADYPRRLKDCYDTPVLLYYKGNADLNHRRILSIVGSRKATEYGKMLCRSLIEGLKTYDTLIVSGLAFGIDVTAHKEAMKNGLPTLGVLGHGLETVYPGSHHSIAREMEKEGGLLSEFRHNTRLIPENFPRRNRVIAGLADATVVVEANRTGGALITAELAGSYNREVFALPGRLRDEYSEGCLYLIKNHKAQLITGADDIAWQLGWEKTAEKAIHGPGIIATLTEEEQHITSILSKTEELLIDELLFRSKIPREKLITILLSLEIKGVINKIPGKGYKIV